ncbi:MAG: hypothetical protein SFY67_10840 [Candidatus Melainabacteria bacterium]|nr:hypothetical protein [Candidatus Melainabacteria bacterium]
MNSQQKLAWRKFQQTFPSDEHCLEKIISGLVKIGWEFTCSRCFSKALKRKFGERRYFCSDCHYKGWILAGTFFEFIRKSRLWLGAIWLFENGIQINAWQFHRLADCAYSTALMIFRKIGFVLNENLESYENAKKTLSENFLSLFWKRSNQTPRGEHPVMEQDCCDQLDMLTNEESIDLTEKNEQLTEEQNAIMRLVSENKVHFDQICSSLQLLSGQIMGELTLLELDDLIERHPGNFFTQKSKKSTKELNNILREAKLPRQQIDAFCDFVKSQIHGISRKYLQVYLAIFWCVEDRKRWSSEKLLQACCRSNFKSSRLLFQYVTPFEVLIS